jgi:hypothetical protein
VTLADADPVDRHLSRRQTRHGDLLVREDLLRGRGPGQFLGGRDGAQDERILRDRDLLEDPLIDQRLELRVGRDVLGGHEHRGPAAPDRLVLDPLRVQDHGRGRRNGEHDSDRYHQTP